MPRRGRSVWLTFEVIGCEGRELGKSSSCLTLYLAGFRILDLGSAFALPNPEVALFDLVSGWLQDLGICFGYLL